MSHTRMLIVPLVLALATLACSITVDLPTFNVETGPTVTDDIDVPLPLAGAVADVELVFGAGRLDISPGAQGALVAGTATYNVEELKPEVQVEGSQVRIAQDENRLRGLRNIGADVQNRWELQIGDAPLDLRIMAGAYQGRIELGGLSLQNLHVSDGAADVRLSFSQPNQVEMETMRYETGASTVTLTGLANANFADMIFRGGAGDYRLEFSGNLERDATVSIQAGLSNLVIVVPEGTAARLSVDSGFSNVDPSGSWRASGQDAYTLSGDGPELNINVDIGAGNLELRN